jgi:predicted RNase H-like nuclease (RuvC/YqgF family)
MPEISGQDLRRLRALEGRLEKARDQARSFATERRELRAAARESEKTARAMERRAGEVEERITALLEENAALASRLDDITADSERLRTAAVELRDRLDGVDAELKTKRADEMKLTRSLQQAESERDRLAERLKLADAQLKSQTTTPVLPAKEVAKLIDDFVDEIGAGLPGMTVREGEVRLQVGFAKVGRATGFVVPSAEAAEAPSNLHEVAFRFDRSRDALEPR